MKREKIQIIWFKKNLRTDDNEILANIKPDIPALVVYFFENSLNTTNISFLNAMTPKICEHCRKVDLHQAYRVQKEKGKDWIFVCGKCCLSLKKGVYYVYGGTWKSKEKRLGQK